MMIFLESYFCKMKSIIKLLLILFLTFQVLPTIVALFENKNTVSLFENTEENDAMNEIKDLKFHFVVAENSFLVMFFYNTKSNIFSSNQMDFDLIPTKIFLTPPENV